MRQPQACRYFIADSVMNVQTHYSLAVCVSSLFVSVRFSASHVCSLLYLTVNYVNAKVELVFTDDAIPAHSRDIERANREFVNQQVWRCYGK